MMKILVISIVSLFLINSLFPASLFFLSLIMSLTILWEIGAYFSDFLSLLSFMVYISGITAVIGYFITFFPKTSEASFFDPCIFSIAYAISSVFSSLVFFTVPSFGGDLIGPQVTILSMSFYGQMLLLLAPSLLIVMVAVVIMTKPERMTLRRW